MDLEEINCIMYILDSETILQKIENYEKELVEVNYKNNDILHYAVLARRSDIVEVLLKKGYDPNYCTIHNNYFIHIIASSYISIPSHFSKYYTRCKELLNDKVYLHLSKSIKVLLIKHALLSNDVSDNDLLCLDDRVRTDELRIIRLLLDYGADVNAVNSYGFTALHDAVRYNNIGIVKLLLSRGIDTTIKSKSGFTAFIYATRVKNVDILKCILKHYNGYKDYIYDSCALTETIYVNTKDIDRVTILLDLGLNVDLRNYLGNTALHVAVEQESYPITELLLSRGADPNAENQIGRTSIYRACCYSKIVKLLLVYGARTVIIDKNNCTPINIIKYVLDNRYDPIARRKVNTVYEYMLSAKVIIGKIVLDTQQYPEIKNTRAYCTTIKSISSRIELRKIMEDCKSEFEKIKTTTILGHTLDTFLLNNININIYRNSEVIRLIKSILELFPNYGNYIKKNMNDANKRLLYMDKQ
ncbi:CNPV233 ankyrin repeat protein [Canarypox virus]|uniref:CNPV233 ankyrin repeat protein n=1 Tax=Canarypox virus TaxID=44088 RepID=Q6VZB4_CNPV|nr:CNPV233 ankyrin repeat protein [Canarypox virus]AAR83579.1 CNPV233 ankyrin repeat protein [Canarypox virus]AWD84709.1 ankyrin repeat protein [Canarypox virus]